MTLDSLPIAPLAKLQRGDRHRRVLVVLVRDRAGAERGHFDDVAGQPAQRVRGVHAGDHEAAAAVSLLHVVGVAGVRLDDRVPVVAFGVDQVAQLAVVEQRADGLKLGVPAQHAAHDRLHAALGDGLADLRRAFRGRVLAGFSMTTCRPLSAARLMHVRPGVGVRAMHDDVDALVVQQLIDRVELLAIDPVRLHQVGGLVRGLVVHADDLGQRMIAEGLHVLPCHPAGADDPYTVALRHLNLLAHDSHAGQV